MCAIGFTGKIYIDESVKHLKEAALYGYGNSSLYYDIIKYCESGKINQPEVLVKLIKARFNSLEIQYYARNGVMDPVGTVVFCKWFYNGACVTKCFDDFMDLLDESLNFIVPNMDEFKYFCKDLDNIYDYASLSEEFNEVIWFPIIRSNVHFNPYENPIFSSKL